MSALTPLLGLFKPARVYSAPVTRCVDTVAPVGLVVRTDTMFAEARAAAPQAVADRIRELVDESGRVVVCSQGGVIPETLAALRPPNVSAGTSFVTPKGQAWVLSFAGSDLVAADPLDGRDRRRRGRRPSHERRRRSPVHPATPALDRAAKSV